MPVHASQMYSKNVLNLLDLMVKSGAFVPDFNDDIVSGMAVTRGSAIVHGPTRDKLGLGPAKS